MQKLINFCIELKELVNNLGRTNIITHQQLDELFVKHNINLKELKKIKN